MQIKPIWVLSTNLQIYTFILNIPIGYRFLSFFRGRYPPSNSRKPKADEAANTEPTRMERRLFLPKATIARLTVKKKKGLPLRENLFSEACYLESSEERPPLPTKCRS